MRKIRVIELFAGYGSQHNALKRLKRDYPEFEYEVVAFCEIDDNAIKAYHALHGDHIPNLGDITQVNPSDVPDCDLMTWSFPCQSISSANR
jgi:DNA (cytosine-5)-methyltransferase 1